MPFDPHNAAPRPYMREGTAALAALVATGPTLAVLSLVYAELQHRDRPAARRLRDELSAMLSSVTAAPQPAPIPPPPPVLSAPKRWVLSERSDLSRCTAGKLRLRLAGWREQMDGARSLGARHLAVIAIHAAITRAALARMGKPVPPSDPAPKPAKRAKLPPMTREENQAARGAHNRLRWAAEAAAERETGRDAYGQPMWPSVPGAAHRIAVPPSVSQYVALNGKVQKGAQVQILPAPRFWPGGTLPEGYQDMGDHVPPIPRKAAPGSKAWRKAILHQMRRQVEPAEKAVAEATAGYANLRRIMRGVMGKPGFRQGNGLENWRAWIVQAWAKRAMLRKAQASLADLKARLA